MDFTDFLLAFWNDWVSLMSGIASVAITIIGIAKEWEKVPRWVFWVTAALCFFFASGRTWTTEHRKYLEVQQQLQQQQNDRTPKLQLEVHAVGLGQYGPKYHDPVLVPGVSVYVWASVANLGVVASTCEEYKFFVRPAGSTLWTEGKTMLIHHNQTGQPTQSRKIYKVSPEDALYNHTYTTGVQPGSKANGILGFVFDGMEKPALAQDGTMFKLNCRDIVGKTVETEMPYKKGLEAAWYILPGTKGAMEGP